MHTPILFPKFIKLTSHSSFTKLLLLFSLSVVSNSLWPHGLQHSRLPYPSLSPRVCSNSCPSKHLILCCSLLLLPSIFASIKVFSNESALHIRWQKYWSFSFSNSPSSEYSGLISFRIDWFDLLAVQGTLKSLLQHRSSKASILWCSALFIVQLSHPYMTTGKTSFFLSHSLFILGIHVDVQSPSHDQLFATPWAIAFQAPLSSTISWILFKFMSIESVTLSIHEVAKVLELQQQSFQWIFRVDFF